jgi:hypothetical protein
MTRTVIGVMVLLTFFSLQPPGEKARAESNLETGGGNPQARLDFRITVPTLLFLQIGNEGTVIDLVSFSVNNIPGTGEVPGTSSGVYPVPVRAAGFVPRGQRMTLRANSSAPLTNGTETILFSNIRWTATGSFQSGRFNNSTADQAVDQLRQSHRHHAIFLR